MILKTRIGMITVLLACLMIFVACDPVVPEGRIEASLLPDTLNIGEIGIIEITYPDTEGTEVVSWSDQQIEIVSGEDIIEVDGLTIKGIEKGSAFVVVTVKAICERDGKIIEGPEFATGLTITVN